MREEWETIVRQIVEESRQDERGADRILMAWRGKLEKEPTLLKPFQIDTIIREVRQRLNPPSR